MIHRSHCVILLALLAIIPVRLSGQASILPTQQEQEEPVKDSLEVVPFSVTEIPAASNETYAEITRWNNEQLTEEENLELTAEVDSFINSTNEFLADTSIEKMEILTSRELENFKNRVNMFIGDLKSLESKFSSRTEEVQVAYLNMNSIRARWQLTRERSETDEVPASILNRIDRVIHGIDSVNELIRTDLEILLDLQGRISDRDIQLTILEEKVSERIQELGGNLFVREMPGFIPALEELKDSVLIRDHINQIRESIKSDTDVLLSEFRGAILFMIIFFLVLVGFSSWYRLNYSRIVFAERVEESEFHMILIRAPLLTALFLTNLVTRFAYPDMPHTYKAVTLMLMMIPTIIFVVRMFHQHVRNWIGWLVAIFMLFVIYEFLFYPDILLRILLLVISIVGVIFFVWILRSRPTKGAIANQFVYRLLRSLIVLFAAMLSVAFIGNMAGAFNLAEFFTLAPIEIFMAALAIFVTTKVTGTIVYLFLISQLLHKLNFVREDFQIIYRKTTRLINIVLWGFYITVAMRILLIKDAVFDWGREVLTTGWKIGAVDITPASILIFILVIWLSVVITRLISRILEKDVFVRVTVAKGVPNTIIMLLRIALITGGFFLAAAAAGMKLTNLSIVLGAFSVGIGFGLQNIFNNMVSGLILAFERPIKVGDVVQVGELVGIVLNIGLRSSVVKSYDGAEVIVPNGNLISDQMINWTRSDSKRRMDHRIGVAYGTDPEKVLEIIKSVAVEHEKVDKFPEPLPLFIGFGDSSLDFRLLSWTDVDYRFTVESQINVAINRKLKEAGIEIPFPQRDLHIKSDATKSARSVENTEKKKPGSVN